MSVIYHPGEDLLWDYFRGVLAPGLSLGIRTHLDLCPHCRGDMRAFEAIGGALLDSVEADTMSEEALDLALARIERPGNQRTAIIAKPRRQPKFLEKYGLPQTLKAANIPGRYWVAPGVWIAPVKLPDPAPGSKTFLLHAPAGLSIPAHNHRGLEVTVILKGAYQDHNGTYRRGDVSICDDADIEHNPGVVGDEDCLCLITREAAIIPRTLIGWLIKPITRI